jgi:hypothetical protein
MKNCAQLAKSSELPQRRHFELSIDKQGAGKQTVEEEPDELGGASIPVHAPRDATQKIGWEWPIRRQMRS